MASPLIQLTGRRIRTGQTSHPGGELADPSPPWITRDGKVRLYGSAGYFLEYPGLQDFFRGTRAKRVSLRLFHPNGARIQGIHQAWDINLHEWDTGEVLYAGAMEPPPGRRTARWPQDNWTRRLFAFRPASGGRWVREKLPVLGTPAREGWVGHSYGHHLVRAEEGKVWLFYERVTEERWTLDGRRLPYLTEIFARRMASPTRTEEEEIPILGVGQPPYAASRRLDWVTGEPSGYLVEGARPVCMRIGDRNFYILGFSSGDFPTDHYGINLAWSTSLLGPYRPLCNDENDLLDLGREIREKHGLSWGPARPAFFCDPTGQWWVLFHAVRKSILPGRDYARWPTEPMGHFFRSVYLAPVSATVEPDGSPRVQIRSN